MSLFADVLKHTSAGHFPEASLMLPRTRSAGSFCLDCSHRKLHPCLTGDLLLPGPRQSAHLLPVPQISSGGRSLLVSLGAAAGFLPVRPAISCLLPSPGWLSPIRQPPSGAWAQIPRSQCHEQAWQRGEAAFRGIQASGAGAALTRERSGRSEGFGKMPVMASLSCAGTSSL